MKTLPLLLSAGLAGFPGLAKEKPNIIYILADDLGYTEIGAYGQKLIETPNLDLLARNGMRFTQHYCGSPVSAPSRCVLLTGRHSGHAYIRGNHEWDERGEVWNFAKAEEDPDLEGQYPLADSLKTIAEYLKTAGYRTGIIGKWGLGAPNSEGAPNRQGFDFFFGTYLLPETFVEKRGKGFTGQRADCSRNQTSARCRQSGSGKLFPFQPKRIFAFTVYR
jgi:arylsulfatase A-like enzyme